LRTVLSGITLHAPQVPYLSDLTGDWITAEQATDPEYWVEQMTGTVRVAEALSRLAEVEPRPLLLEVGPGQGLSSLVKLHPAWQAEEQPVVLPTLPARYESCGEVALLLKTLGRSWLAGSSIDWQGFYAQERRQRIPLPTYPFEHQRFWVEGRTPAPSIITGTTRDFSSFEEAIKNLQKQSLDKWFYLPAWKRSIPLNPFVGEAKAQSWLLLADEHGFARSLQRRLAQHGQDVILVRASNSFERITGSLYRLRPGVRADYDALLQSLQAQNRMPGRIVHLWTLTADSSAALSENLIAETLDKGFYSLLCLAQAIGDSGLEDCQISVISNGLHNVTGSEQLHAEKATLLGPCRVIPLEYPRLSCRSIDIVLPPEGSKEEETLVDLLLSEMGAPVEEFVVAIRGPHRWLQTYEPVSLTSDTPTRRLRQGGVYLITGGLGGVGLGLAEYLARTQQAKLVLLGRSRLPERESWPDLLATEQQSCGIGYKIRQLQALEALGAEVLTVAADVVCEDQMYAAIQQAVARFGTIHGVIHAAGVPGIGLMQMKSPEQAAKVLAPKVAGTLILAKALREFSLDFLVLCSSITSFMGGGPGQVDYCAANAFLDAFAQNATVGTGPVISINWGEWQWNAWEEGLEGYDKNTQQFFRDNRKRFGISFADGSEALRRVLASSFAQVIVSPQDFRVFAEVGKAFTAASILKNVQQQQQEKHPRPSLGSSYLAPSTEMERRIAAIWEELLGIAGIGMQDNFFELGGNSLIGLDAIARLRKALTLESLPAYVLYEAPTVGAMARYLEQHSKPTTEIADRHDRGEKRSAILSRRMSGMRQAR